jgi:hypothetical protein
VSRGPWHCHDCPTTAPTLAAARRHAKATPVIAPDGRMLTHKLTQDAERAELERADRAARWARPA